MEYMTIQEAAALWSLSERRVQVLCSSGRIEGAAMFGRQWAIPAYASKPVDARVSNKKKKQSTLQCGVITMANGRNPVEFSPEAVLSQIDYNAIKELINKGVYFVPATGRAFDELPKHLKETELFRYYIVSDGAKIYDKEKNEMFEFSMNKEKTKQILNFC